MSDALLKSKFLPCYCTSTLALTEPSTKIQTALDVIPLITSTPFDLPHWVKYSFLGGILALPYRGTTSVNPSKVVLINPEDGDKFFIELSKEFYSYYWRKSETIVFFHEGDCDI